MAEAKGGVYVTFAYNRREVLKEYAESHGRFSIDFSSADWQLGQKEMFVMSLSENPSLIECAAIGRRKGGPQNTGAHNIEFSGFVHFEPVKLNRLLERISEPARATIKDREGNRGKYFPPVAWRAFLDVLQKFRPAVAEPLETLWKRVNAEDVIDRGKHALRLGMQRDAIGLSLDIAGMAELRRREFRKVLTTTEVSEAESFTDLMDAQLPQERMLIDHDRSVLEKVIARGDSRDVTTFSSGLRALRVWTVDHGPIERFAGVDLVFLNQDYNSLLLIQYKCMEKDSHSDQWNYHPNAQFHKEMERMRKVGLLIGKRTPAEAKLLDIRLDLGALYFKFCKRLPLSQQDGELADGMIVSLATTRMFLETSEKGLPRSRAIGYETCPRYLSNSLFSALARDGWIGSRGLSHQQYQEILGFVHERDETSLVLAEAGTMLPRS